MLDTTDFKKIDKLVLKKLCKNCVKNYSTMKKQELFDNFNKVLAIKLIQRCYRNHFYKNAIDPITLDQVSFPCFVYRTKSGKHYFYNYESIIKNIMKTMECFPSTLY
jgi:hypothetical protein